MERPARFYHPHGLEDDSIVLDEAESHHAAKVRRLGPGDRIEIFDGSGSSRYGVIEPGPGRQVRVAFDAPLQAEPLPDRTLTILLSPPRGERMAFAVEKLSEIGCDRILPVVFSRSVDAGVRAATGRTSKWRRKAIEAAKQCGRNHIVAIDDPLPLAEALAAQTSAANRLLLDIEETAPAAGAVFGAADLRGETAVIVGPEGGFTREGQVAIVAWGAQPVRLWRNVLRIETAALAAAILFADAASAERRGASTSR